MEDGDALPREHPGDERARHKALLVIAPACPEHIVEPLFRQQRIGGGRRHLQDAFLVIDFGCGDRGTGAEMPGHEHDTLVHHLVGDCHRLLRLAGVIADLEHELLAENTAGGVDVVHRHARAAHHLLTENGVLARHRSRGRHDHFCADRCRQPAAQGGAQRRRHSTFRNHVSSSSCKM